MILKIHSDHIGALDAIKSFLNIAIDLQNAGSIVIDDRTDEEDFIGTYGFSKDELAEGLKALQEALNR